MIDVIRWLGDACIIQEDLTDSPRKVRVYYWSYLFNLLLVIYD